ncbi:MAG: YggS family pyridoxal phosphate-dependent enzyme [Sphingomonadales bacterium]|nr:YggS family pyridoxal phosphate-dependent enzyme [Sphingomonadales bacterium]
MTDSNQVAINIAAIKKTIHGAAAGFAHKPALICVSKTHEAMEIVPVLDSGHRVFGENRVQEAMDKWSALKDTYDGVELHLIGGLQTNKAKVAVEFFDVIQTLDRMKLARALKKAMDEVGKAPRLYVQVNTGEEEQKGGVMLDDLADFLRDVAELGLKIEGLMCIPPTDEEPSLHFALLNKLAKRHGVQKLSMGMSGDFEVAAQLGANYVRVGTAIFGARDYG